MASDEEISDQQKEYAVRDYCLKRELNRPKTNIVTVMLFVVFIESLVFTLMFGVGRLLEGLDISFSYAVLHASFGVLVWCAFLKKLCVLTVELYQHYASDATRRRCTLMPSCSEYALLALQKYNIFKALRKIFVRVNYTCNGTYLIDYP